jgi:PAT family beta-lactamase induction signal transducer AmpG
MVLIAPFGAISGFVSVTVAWQLKAVGVSVAQVAGIVALVILPHTWKFLWAPIVDTTLTQKYWYLVSCLATGLGITAIGFMPETQAGLSALATVVFIASLATTFMGMSVESLMAYSTPDELKGRAGGWFQAGNLGGGGLGGGLGLWLATRVPEPWMPSAIVGGLCLACSLALLAVPSPPLQRHASFVAGLRESVRDLWIVIRERSGLIALILCFMPIGSGAAGGLWSAVAVEWNASADTVALVTGTLGGIVSAAGCIVGGWICDRMDRKNAYVIYGLLQAACAITMAMLPRTEISFVVLTTAYAFIAGLTYAGFTAFVLEVIGKGAAATKYSVYASLSNMPIWYMTNVDGWAHDRFGSSGMLYTEAALCCAGAVLFIVLALALRPRRPAAVPVSLP